MKMYSLSTHHYADGGVGEVIEQNTLGVSGVNGVAAKMTPSLDVIQQRKKNITCLHTACLVSSKCPQALTFILDSKKPYFAVF